MIQLVGDLFEYCMAGRHSLPIYLRARVLRKPIRRSRRARQQPRRTAS